MIPKKRNMGGELRPISVMQIAHSNTPKHRITMNRSICIPDMTQAYSLCIEYVQRWFLDKFQQDFFKTVYLEGKHIFDDFRSISKRNLLKRPKPAVAIVPSLDLSFNNDGQDIMMFGLDVYQPQGRFKDAFFNDEERNLHLGIDTQLLLMSFNFKLKFATKAQQLDLFQHMKYAFRNGSVFGVDVDMDYHMPYALMIQIATDAGFEVYKEDEDDDYPHIKNIRGFLNYLNRHSLIPFLYKLRTVNGHNEFFLRMQRMYVHLQTTDLSADDGNRVGHLMDDFNIDYNVEVKFPAPKLYAYYSVNDHNLNKLYSVWNSPDGNITTLYAFTEAHLPSENTLGWPLLITTTYEEEDLSKNLVIDFSELFDGDIKECIDDSIDKAISPSIFIDVLIVNGREQVKGIMKWQDMKFISTDPPISKGSFIAIYVDNAFIDNYLLDKRKAYDNRINQSTEHPEDIIEPAKKESYLDTKN